MTIFRCKMCGGDLEVTKGASSCTCEFCGTQQTLPKANDDSLVGLFNRANVLRMKSEFDKAAEVYEKILQRSEGEAEAYWGLILCKYGIEYVEDPATGKRVPTCHRVSYDAVAADEDYHNAIKYADTVQRDIYEAEAATIDEIQKGIIALAQKEDPYDVFICYKETDENGKRTKDSAIANDIYHQLTNEGFKVFYAAITLENKLGTEYESYIFSALNTAKVMLVLGTTPEHFDAVWVKNEWSRFLKIMKKDRSKMLIPCYRDMDPYELPEEFAHLQAQDMSKIGFINDIVRGIKKVTSVEQPQTKGTVVIKEIAAGGSHEDSTAPLLKRTAMFLEDGDWKSTEEYCERVLDIAPENAYAYLYKLMAKLKVRRQDQLKNCAEPFDSNAYYAKIKRFGDESLVNTLNADNEYIRERNETTRKQGIYDAALKAFTNATTGSECIRAAVQFECIRAAVQFECISGFKDADQKAKECRDKAAELKKQQKKATKIAGIAAIIACICAAIAVVFVKIVVPNINYNKAVSLMNAGKCEEAIAAFEAMDGYKDSYEQIRMCEFTALKTSTIGSEVAFGSYEQDNDNSNGTEPIEWIVLDKNESSVLLISKYALRVAAFSNSPIRTWLNETFINGAFNKQEIDAISATERMEVGEKDKIFLLTKKEAQEYSSNSTDWLLCKPTAFADVIKNQVGYCSWWLSSSSTREGVRQFVVKSDGKFSDARSSTYCGVRPAMWISLES